MFHRSSADVDSSRTASRGLLGALVLLLALAVPPAVQAQGGMGQGQRQSLMKLRQVNQQLAKIRRQAMQDSALQARQQKLTQLILSEMRSLDDSTAARVDRMTTLREDLRTAQQEQDTASARTAIKELRKISKSLTPARKKVLKRPEIQKRVKVFQKALRAEMSEINPNVDSLRAVADSLSRQLRGGMGGGPGGPGSSGGSGGSGGSR